MICSSMGNLEMCRILKIAILAAAGLTLLTGCGKTVVPGRPETAPVTGQVLADGEPLKECRLVFAPQDHQYAAAGITDEAGRFSLQTFEPGDGAVPGKFKIMVMKFTVVENPNGSVTETHFLPDTYRDPAASGLGTIVKKGESNEVTLQIKNASPRQIKVP